MGKQRKYQRHDRLYEKARQSGLASRAGFKLQELQSDYALIRPGDAVMDLGAAPGAWTQVAADLVGPEGLVVAVDLEELSAAVSWPPTVRFYQGDVTEAETVAWMERQLEEAKRPKIDVLLSDLSPKLTGIKTRDQQAVLDLLHLTFRCAKAWLRPKGSLVAKVFPGGETDDLRKTVFPLFSQARAVRVDASRQTSREVYWVCEGYLGNKD